MPAPGKTEAGGVRLLRDPEAGEAPAPRRHGGRLALRLGAGLALLLALAWGLVVAASERRLGRVYALPAASLAPASRGDAVRAEGERLVTVVAQCTLCHGVDLGGQQLADDVWLGRLHAPNLTPGRGGIRQREDADLLRAIRHGLGPDGRPLLMMPSQHYQLFTEAELGAVIAYLRGLPAVDRPTPPRRVGPLTRLLLASGGVADLLPAETIDHAAQGGRGAPPSPGARLVDLAACSVCHHADLRGGLHPLALPGEPVPPDLTPCGPLAEWSAADFVRTLRSGVTPDGRRLDAQFMPWPSLGRLDDAELDAIWSHLRGLPADCPTGGSRGPAAPPRTPS